MSDRMIDGVLWRSGGVEGGRAVNGDDPFENMLDAVFAPELGDNEALATELWQALTNTTWTHPAHGSFAYSFRAAGDVVAALIGQGDYIDWYCCARPQVVSERVGAALLEQGWKWTPTEMPCG